MKQRKTIDDIYNEVKDFDLVICFDPALADALNKRIEKPRLGMFAETLRGFVFKKEGNKHKDFIFNDFEMVEYLRENLKIKNISYMELRFYFNLLKDCWDKKGKTNEKIQPFPKFVEIPYYIADRMNELRFFYNVEKERLFWGINKIAVVGYEYLTEYEKMLLPKGIRKIDIFFGEDMPPSTEYKFLYFKNKKEAVKAVADLITDENKELIGIVANSNSEYSIALKLMLFEKGVDVVTAFDINNDVNFKRLISLMNLSLDIDNIKVGDIIGIVPKTESINIESDFYDYYLKDYVKTVPENSFIVNFFNILNEIPELTFKEFCDKYLFIFNVPYFERVVNIYAFDNRKIKENLYDFEYLISHYGYEIQETSKGVLFADANTSYFIDRPYIFYFFADNDWINKSNELIWVSKIETRKNIDNEIMGFRLKKQKEDLERFLCLIQNGVKRIFVFPEDKNFIPCYYFNEIGFDLEKRKEFVFLLKDNDIFKSEKEAFFKITNKKEKYNFESISSSSLSNFVVCPRRFMLSRLLKDVKELNVLKGKIIHDFAELCFWYKDVVVSKGIDFFANEALNILNGLVDDFRKENLWDWFYGVMTNVLNFIDINERHFDVLNIKELVNSNMEDNSFFYLIKDNAKKRNKGGAETKFKYQVRADGNTDANFLIEGRFDLILSDTQIVDYKTSTALISESKILKNNDIHKLSSTSDFQAILYIYALSKFVGNKKLRIKFYYPSIELYEQMKKISNKNFEIEVVYIPKYFKEYVMEEDFINYMKEQKTNKKFIENIGESNFLSIIMKYIDGFEKKIYMDNMLPNNLIDELSDFSPNKDAKKRAELICKKILKLRNKYLFKSDLEAFENFIKEKFMKIVNSFKTGFEKKPIDYDACKKCRYKDVCEVEL